MRLTENFRLKEFESPDILEVKPEYLGNIQRLAEALQVVRDRIGAPLRVNSGYRTKSHNSSVGGSKLSQHLWGKAADLSPPEGMGSEELWEHFDLAIRTGEIPDGGLGLYDNFVHYDIRGTPARWDERTEE